MESFQPKNRLFLKFFIPVLGVILVLVGLLIAKINYDFIGKSTAVEGTIVGYETVVSYDSSDRSASAKTTTTYKAKISYYVNGQSYQRTSSSSSGTMPKQGKKIKLYYLQGNPEIAKVSSDLFLLPIVFIFFGGIILLAVFLGKKAMLSGKYDL